jgi:hypothetical protein
VITIVFEYDEERAAIGRARNAGELAFDGQPVQVVRTVPDQVPSHGAMYGPPGGEPPPGGDPEVVVLGGVVGQAPGSAVIVVPAAAAYLAAELARACSAVLHGTTGGWTTGTAADGTTVLTADPALLARLLGRQL